LDPAGTDEPTQLKEAIMATKLFKRTNDKDVFDRIIEHDDPPAAEDTQAITDSDDVETSETAQSARDVDDTATAPTDTDADDHRGAPIRRAHRLILARRTRNEPVAVEPAEGDTGDAETHDAPPSRRKRWPRYTLTAVVILIFVAALGSSGYFGWQYKQQEDIDSASRAALSSAERFAVTLTSIDINSIDQNFAQVQDGSTGEFKDMYSQSASQLRQVLIDNKAMSKGTIIDSAVKAGSKTNVDVVLFVDQWITNVASPQPRLDRSRVAMTMELVDGRWLASKVELK
jgi:Mce-associated membrane protein